MRKSSKIKVLSALTVASAAGMYGQVAHAAGVTVNEFYVSAQYAKNSLFAGSTLVTVPLSTLSSATPTISIPVGDFFRFGIEVAVGNNPDPESGSAWDTWNQNNNSQAPLPVNLGLATLGFTVPSTDAGGTTLWPLTSDTGTHTLGTDPQRNHSAEYNASDVLNPHLPPLAVGSVGDVEDGGPTGPNANSDPQYGGQVGIALTIFEGSVNTASPGYLRSNNAARGLGNFSTGASATSASNSTVFFSNLTYKGLQGGTITLSPSAPASQLEYWKETSMGSVSTTTTHPTPALTIAHTNVTDPVFAADNAVAGDSVGSLAPLTIVITSAAPTGPVITLTSGGATQTLPQLIDSGTTVGNAAHHGKFSNTSAGASILTVVGGNGGYVAATATGINSGGTFAGDGNDYVKLAGFNPASDQEIIALKLDNNGSAIHGNTAMIAAIINDINTANDATFFGTKAGTIASTVAFNASLASQFANFDLLLTIPTAYLAGLTAGSPTEFNFGFDFTAYTDGPAGVTDATVTDLAVVPEPGAGMGILALAGLGLLGYRKRKDQTKPEIA